MQSLKPVTLLAAVIILLSLAASASGVLWQDGGGPFLFKSIRGQEVEIYGRGLYSLDSVSAATQAMAQDYVTIFMGIPLLAVSMIMSRKGGLRGRLLLAGTLGYFLYTYASYSFLSMYNPLFLVYVATFSASLFAFIMTMMSFDTGKIRSCFSPRFPVKFVGGFLIFVAVAVMMLWLGRIAPSLLSGAVPEGLEHYSTLVIQALDLGVVVPAALLAGILQLRKRPWGYLLSSVVVMKGITMLTAVSAMAVGMVRAGVSVSAVELVVFPLFDMVGIACMVLILKNVREK